MAERHDLSDVRLFAWDYEALFALPIVVFGFNCHANVVTIFRCAPPLPSTTHPACLPVASSLMDWPRSSRPCPSGNVG